MNAGLILFLIFILCRGVRGPSGLLHGYRPKDLWRAAVQLYHGHCIFCAGWQSYDEGGDFQADCRFCGLSGGQRERRYEPGAGTGLCILCCPIWIGPCNGHCHRNHALRGYDQKGLSRAADRRTSGSVRWAWAHHPAIYYHGDLLYADRCLCWKYVQAGDDDWYCDYAGTDGGGAVVCP